MSKYWVRVTDLLPGSTAKSGDIDGDLDAVNAALDAVEEDVFRGIRFTSDSGLVESDFQVATTPAQRANKTLGFDDSGMPAVVADVGAWEGDWAQSTAYVPKSIVKAPASHFNSLYICLLDHTSTNDFATDLAAGNWDLMVDLSSVQQSIITHSIVTNAESPYAMASGEDVMVDVSAGNVILTLPASPVITDQPVNVMHVDGTLGVDGTLTIARNGSNIMGLAEDMSVAIENASFGLAYCDGTRGWRIRGV